MLATRKNFEDVVIHLLKSGATIGTIHPKTGQNSMMIAAENNNERLVKLFLKHGAFPEIPDSIGNTPLHIGVQKNN